jgi:hypothetical protein
MKATQSRIELELVKECLSLLHSTQHTYEVLRRGTYVIEVKQLYCLLPSNTQKHHRILLKVVVSCNTLVRQSIELCWNIYLLNITEKARDNPV